MSLKEAIEYLDVNESEVNRFFTNNEIEAVFQWIFVDEADTWEDVLALVDEMSTVSLEDLKNVGAKNVKEYMVFTHENVCKTPYGLVYMY